MFKGSPWGHVKGARLGASLRAASGASLGAFSVPICGVI